ncbi:NUDIX hydrolase [Nitrosospira multiformis ATCC 25196]|uniref:GDP-mannose pyrophosphatase n=2 Tax=Nitrosospira multiformis (strain ATCC 25196 / NCIMB 11849 / C 71) TaxID=323848 RepID=Q2Y6U6_NITMU|nr:NUDIX hydrolase [Nitrosospira multiformis ATCC 25196]
MKRRTVPMSRTRPEHPDLTETTVSSQKVFEGDLLHVYQDHARLPDGKVKIREYIAHPGAVVIIPLLDNGELVLERQFRYPLHRDFYELPAGKIDSGEDPLACAQRELLEETGYTAKSWRYITTLHPCIGYSNEKLIYYLAQELTFEGANLDDGEYLEIFTLPPAEALEWIKEGKITDNKSVSGLFWAEKILRGEWAVKE